MKVRKPRRILKDWGYEDHIGNFKDLNNGAYCGKLLGLNEGYRSSIHRHPKNETFYVLEGIIYLELENEDEGMEGRILGPGDVVNIFDNKWHRFSGLKDSIIVEFSTPDEESERKVLSGKIPNFENWKKEIGMEML
jgi:quercetin dioxygenase-like cupin family protein